MSAKPLADVYEKLKELRRLGGESTVEIPSSIGSTLETYVGVVLKGISDDSAELGRKLHNLSVMIGKSDQSDQSDKLIRAIEIKTLADRVFGDEEKAETWLQRRNASLSGQRPIDLLKDELGTAVVREMLEQVDHGIFA